MNEFQFVRERRWFLLKCSVTIDCGFVKQNTKMESSTERESLLRQADHLWKMLDNMAENNPEGYQRFIKKQLQEGSEHLKPPEPVFCLSCEIDKVPFCFAKPSLHASI